MIEAFPLAWPLGYPRSPWFEIKEGRFDTTFAIARDEIVREIKRFGGKDTVISSNIPLRQDGLPYASSGYKKLDDVGVAVYFIYNGSQFVFACDKWKKIEHNMQAIRKTIEAMRGLDRWGVSEMLNRAFSGFKAIPEQAAAKDWWDVLKISKTATREMVIAAYRTLAKIHHPDAGGSSAIFMEINNAYGVALKTFS